MHNLQFRVAVYYPGFHPENFIWGRRGCGTFTYSCPHEVLRNVFLYINLILVLIREMLLTYIIIPKYMLPPPLSHFPLSLSLPLPLSLSLSPFSLSFSFLLGGKLGSLGGKLPPRPPPPPLDETLLSITLARCNACSIHSVDIDNKSVFFV